MKVLIVVDVQNDFCPGGALAVNGGDEVVPVVNRLARSGLYDRVVASLDWHPGNHVSYADNHPGKNVFETVDAGGIAQTLWPRHCEQGTKGAELHPGLDQSCIDFKVYKGTSPAVDSYSAFFENDGRSETSLREYLQELTEEEGVAVDEIELSIVGLATDYCVAFTAKDAARLGFKTEVIVDGCRAVNLNPGGDGVPSDEVRTLRDLIRLGVSVKESREVLEERTVGRGRSADFSRGTEISA